MKLYGYTCPVCGGKKGRQFNHEKCSQIMKAKAVKHRKKQHQNYDYIMKTDLNTQPFEVGISISTDDFLE